MDRPGTRALVKVGYRCDQDCAFCHAKGQRGIEATGARVHQLIARAATLGHGTVVLSGGEPTLRSELGEWAAHAGELGLGLGLVTHGQRLGDRDLAARLLDHGLGYVHLALHGLGEVHRQAVGVDAAEGVLAALANLSGRGVRLVVNCVVTRLNLTHLDELVAALAGQDLLLKLSAVEPKGAALARYDELVPPVTETARAIAAAFAHAALKPGSPEPWLVHDGVPLCLLPGLEALRSDLRSERFTMMVEADEPDFFPVDDRNRVHPDCCRLCVLRGRCPGLFHAAFERDGTTGLSPVLDGPRSNSFNYVLDGGTVRMEGSACPVARAGVSPWDRGRVLWVCHGTRVARFRAETRDFTDADILDVKLRLGQVYMDVSRKASPDDFARDLAPLVRCPSCASCPDDTLCTGLYQPLLDDLFTRDELRTRTLIAALEGDVLDVGCGEARHAELLARAALEGRVRYLGLDPDAERLARLAARCPWARLRVGTDEDLDPNARFDHVLALGSWNHLPDPAASASRWVGWLRAGGSLLVCDDVPFGLARTKRKAARAERSATALEHRRNDDARDADRMLRPLGLELCERHDVGLGTSNRWLLRYRKPG
jgi:pyruvate-formate lyase-activating enzyme/2-polyprenyl-3-methyl-5-hydroxy-6-metoxy-1,4-benzoquinol methylase